MEDKAVNNEVKTEETEKKNISRANVILIVIGAVVAVLFVALIVWISSGAKVKEEKKKEEETKIKVETPAKFEGNVCVVPLPKLEREGREPVTPEFRLVKVEKGSFTMSEPPTAYLVKVRKDGKTVEEKRVRENEKPHKITFENDFYIAETEVTQAQWMAVMGIKQSGAEKGKEKKSYFTPKKDEDHPNGSDDLPVEMVSWDEAMKFCEKLNKSGFAPEGWMFSLPTETQWEYAARGGKLSKGYKYSGGNDLDEVAWCKSNNAVPRDRKLTKAELKKDKGEREKNHPVKQKKPNELGLYDMSGNVWEWCLDDYRVDSSTAKAEFTRSSKDAGDTFRVIRGGSWYTDDAACTVTVRSQMSPGGRAFYLGFRVALVRKPAEAATPAPEPTAGK